MKKWEDKKDLVFSHVFGWRDEKVGGGKLFCLIGDKKEYEKCDLYKLTIMSLLYNSGKLKGIGECNKVGGIM